MCLFQNSLIFFFGCKLKLKILNWKSNQDPQLMKTQEMSSFQDVPQVHTAQDKSTMKIKVYDLKYTWDLTLLTWARVGFWGRMTPTKLYKNDNIKEFLVMKVVTKLSSIVGIDFLIHTNQYFKSATINQRKNAVICIVCLTTCRELQNGAGIGPCQALIKSISSINPTPNTT